MLNFNNPEDRPKMMMYHRTRDMINLLTYFPELSPVENLTIVKSVQDYYDNYQFCKGFVGVRNDNPITKPSMKSIEVRGKNPNIIEVLNKIKELDPSGVVVLFDLCHEPSERYERYAGISVGIVAGYGVTIEAVGKGFDGREVTKGLSTHERYFIPWFDLRTCNIENFKNYRTFLISDEAYKKSREKRVEFLKSIDIDEDTIEEQLPKEYKEIPDFIWLDVIKHLLKKLMNMEEELALSGLTDISIGGHTEGKRFLPWQLTNKTRQGLNTYGKPKNRIHFK